MPNRRPTLQDITLCAITSTNLTATIRALEASQAEIEFAEVLLFTHFDKDSLSFSPANEIKFIPISKVGSSEAYSQFVIEELFQHIGTSHCLIVQWDGHVIDSARWRDEFLEYDYIGASWPQFDDGHSVGNGGFSLRSRRLMEACIDPEFRAHHPEDIAICRTNRALLESRGMRFAPVDIADSFAAERAGEPSAAFGFHGVFLMPEVLGVEGFWELYGTLTDRKTVWVDFASLVRALLSGKDGLRRTLRMVFDRFFP